MTWVQVIRNLRVICISHLHADHHLGTIKLLLAHRQLYNDMHNDKYTDKHNDKYTPITVIAPKLFQAWLCDYSQIQPLLYTFIDCAALQYNVNSTDSECIDSSSECVDNSSSESVESLQRMGVRVRSVAVIHCPDAFAFILQTKHWKLV